MLSVSDTAYSIALVRSLERELPPEERLFDDPYASLFASAGAHAAEGTQRFMDLPFFRDGIRLRTRYLDDAVRDAIAAGLKQLVLMGVGFDARGLRIPEIAANGVHVFEVDFAEMIETKQRILAANGVAVPSAIAFVPCDFRAPDFEKTLASGLEAHGFVRGAGAIFVWEGVIGYITDDEIDRSLRFMAREGGPGTRVAFTFGHMTFDDEPGVDRLRRAGFDSFEEYGCDDLWRRYLAGEPPEVAWVSRLGLASIRK